MPNSYPCAACHKRGCVAAGRADEAAEELEAKKYGTFGSEE